MKKLKLALMLLGLSSTAAYAGGIDYQEPEESGVFMVGVEFHYAQPCDSDFLFAEQETADANNNVVAQNYGVDFDYDWVYHLDLGYAMPGDGPDFELGFTKLCIANRETKAQVSGSNFQRTTGATFNFGAPNGVAAGKTSYDYFDVDLLIGKEFVLQNRYHFHPFTGVRHAHVDATDKVAYTFNNSFLGSGRIDNCFCGTGVRAGVDSAYEIANGFSLVARAAGSLLIGKHGWKYQTTNSGLVENASSLLAKSRDHTACVPQVDYRLGINYLYEFSAETSLGLELGWDAVHYFDVLDRSNAMIVDTVGQATDWGFQGPYFRIQANLA